MAWSAKNINVSTKNNSSLLNMDIEDDKGNRMHITKAGIINQLPANLTSEDFEIYIESIIRDARASRENEAQAKVKRDQFVQMVQGLSVANVTEIDNPTLSITQRRKNADSTYTISGTSNARWVQDEDGNRYDVADGKFKAKYDSVKEVQLRACTGIVNSDFVLVEAPA